MSALLVLTNVANYNDAKDMARVLVSKKLCACVNINAKCTSIYYWQNKIEETEECTLLIKTNLNKYTALEKQIKQMHKYQIPEIIAIEINQGSSEYLNWINSTMLE